jgi:hypothetical protein
VRTGLAAWWRSVTRTLFLLMRRTQRAVSKH